MSRWYFDHGPYEGLHHHTGAGGIVGLVLMIILWIVVVAALVLAIRALILYGRRNQDFTPAATPPTRYSAAGPPEAAPASGQAPHAVQAEATPATSSLLATLEQRYARGELDRDEFLQRKRDLGLG